jgi:hypothetical protein
VVLHLPVFAVKLSEKAEGGSLGYHVWPLQILLLCLPRLLLREHFSSTGYSMFSLLINALIWAARSCFMLAGDRCLARYGKSPSPAAYPFEPCCNGLFITNTFTHVTQAYLPLKLIITGVGCLCTSYMHMLFQDGALE